MSSGVEKAKLLSLVLAMRLLSYSALYKRRAHVLKSSFYSEQSNDVLSD